MRDLESIFESWAQGPGKTEEDRCDNAISAIRDAINSSHKLQNRGVNVFLQGSYRNEVNVRQDSDVDVGVVCTNTFFYDYPDGADENFSGHPSSNYTFKQFKAEVGEALVNKFGRGAVARGSKAFDIKENSYRVESDVAVFFEYRDYRTDKSYIKGVALMPDNDDRRIYNYPEQHYENGAIKDEVCNGRYRELVRILKKLSNEMEDSSKITISGIPSFLCECLIWNVLNEYFNTGSYTNDLRNCLLFAHKQLEKTDSNNWLEVSDLKSLFHSSQKWTKQEALDFIFAAWNYIGFEQ